MPKSKGALRRIPDEVNLEIARYTLEHPEMTREAIAGELTAILTKKSQTNPIYTPPQDTTIVRKVSRIRNTVIDGLDTPWHMGTLDNFPLPGEAVPYVFAVQGWAERNSIESITTRQAKWIGRFFGFLPWPMTEDDTGALWQVTNYYAIEELISTLSQVPFDSRDIDRALRHKEMSARVTQEALAILDGTRMTSFYAQAMKTMGIIGKDGDK